jgi:hypothetical protein
MGDTPTAPCDEPDVPWVSVAAFFEAGVAA